MSVALTLLNGGVDYFEQVEVHKVANGDLTVNLYTNNHAPAVTDLIGAYTLCTLAGYAANTIAGAGWTGSSAAGVATYSPATVTFTFSAYAGGTTIYGMVLTNGAGAALGAALLDTPFAVPAGGGSLTIGLTATLQKYP